MLPLAFRRLAVRHDQKKEVRARAPALLLQGLCVVALASAYTTDGAITARIVAAMNTIAEQTACEKCVRSGIGVDILMCRGPVFA